MQTSDYQQIAENLNKNPLRVPRHEGNFTESFMQYLKLIYTPEEAAVVKYLLPLPKFLSTEEI
ncbi:MAG: hypothetical protein GY754_01280, partial [bacterium]|nr:hypothetical protein [bacterium]